METEAKSRMQKAVDHFEGDIKQIRTGRAQASMLDGVMVEAYGQAMPLNQVGNIMVLDAQMLQIQPFDPSNLQAIADGIRKNQDLGLNPSDDGKVVRVPIPPMTEDRRKHIIKSVHEKAEETKISLRNIRHDALKEAKSEFKAGSITQDDYHGTENKLNEMIDKFQRDLDEKVTAKEKELLTV